MHNKNLLKFSLPETIRKLIFRENRLNPKSDNVKSNYKPLSENYT